MKTQPLVIETLPDGTVRVVVSKVDDDPAFRCLVSGGPENG